MKMNWTKAIPALLLGLGIGAPTAHAAAPATPQGFISGKAFYNIGGTAVSALTSNADFPSNPDEVFFFPYFEWNATGDINTPPGNFADNYGGQIVGYFYPPATGNYVFYLAADDNAVLYLSTDSDPANKKLIAQETAWSNFREYQVSGGSSDITAKDSSQFTGTEWPTPDPFSGGALITLTQGQPYYIEALFKEGGGGDNLSVSFQDPTFSQPFGLPIAGQYLSSDQAGPVTIEVQPQDQTTDERGSATFSVRAAGTPPYTYQWRRAGDDIPDATNDTFTVTSAAMADHNVAYSVVVSGAEGTPVTSDDAILTVTPDTEDPTLLSAVARPNQTEVVLAFSEPLDPATAGNASNYQISSSGGALNITGATVSGSGRSVTLTTAPQTLGNKYTVTVNNLEDTAATPNTIAADSTAVFFPVGDLVMEDGMVVFEVENFDRNTSGLWELDTTRGNPSGGASMVVPNGTAGADLTTMLEYDIDFTATGTFRVWYRASADDTGDDSAWLYLDGFPPFERSAGNDASMQGFANNQDFVWANDAQSGTDPFSVDVLTPGLHTIAIVHREDGAFFDKMILTTNTAFTPTGTGPAETREGAPGAPTISLTAPTEGQNFSGGSAVTISADAQGDSGLLITSVEFLVNGVVVGEDTTSPFSFDWTVPALNYVLPFEVQARATDEMGQTVTSESVEITAGTPPPGPGANIAWVSFHSADDTPSQAALDAGFTEAADVKYTRLLELNGHNVTRFVTIPDIQNNAALVADLNTNDLVMISRSVPSDHYQDAGETETWSEQITVPMMILGGYVLRDSRMGYTTGGTMIDTTGTIRLEVTDPSHPIFSGIALDSENVMVDPYAGVVTFNGITERGISVNNNPLEGNGTILATVATAGDPTSGAFVIAEWESGANLNAGTDTLASDRLVFLTGSREHSGLTSQGAGIYDLNAAGATMLLNAVGYMTGGVIQPPTPDISISRTGDQISINFDGTLEAADTVDGTYTEVATDSPYTVDPTAPMRFYRARQ